MTHSLAQVKQFGLPGQPSETSLLLPLWLQLWKQLMLLSEPNLAKGHQIGQGKFYRAVLDVHGGSRHHLAVFPPVFSNSLPWMNGLLPSEIKRNEL